MNYRHAFHAGNFADVLKHLVLFALLDALKAKPTPFAVVDTHAGSGAYALGSGESEKTGEWREGIGRLLFPAGGGPPLPPLLRHWLDLVTGLPENRQTLALYPGSPLQIARLLREQDSAHLCELQDEEANRLRQCLHGDRRMHVHHRDGYEALKALLPPKEKRGLVLIDPPYEAQENEYRLIEAALTQALQRWPTGMFAVWYPIKQRSQVQPFLRWLGRCGARRVLRAELLLRPDDSPLRLNGSGMAVLNAPWQLDSVLREPLAAVARLLGEGQPAQWRIDWLAREAEQAAPLSRSRPRR